MSYLIDLNRPTTPKIPPFQTQNIKISKNIFLLKSNYYINVHIASLNSFKYQGTFVLILETREMTCPSVINLVNVGDKTIFIKQNDEVKIAFSKPVYNAMCHNCILFSNVVRDSLPCLSEYHANKKTHKQSRVCSQSIYPVL